MLKGKNIVDGLRIHQGKLEAALGDIFPSYNISTLYLVHTQRSLICGYML
jgi:hypothetical protein